jgi:hypothetical protein
LRVEKRKLQVGDGALRASVLRTPLSRGGFAVAGVGATLTKAFETAKTLSELDAQAWFPAAV